MLASVPASAAGGTATIALVTAATLRPAAATFGAPTAAASAWDSSRSGGKAAPASNHRLKLWPAPASRSDRRSRWHPEQRTLCVPNFGSTTAVFCFKGLEFLSETGT